MKNSEYTGISRRGFLKTLGAVGGSALLGFACSGENKARDVGYLRLPFANEQVIGTSDGDYALFSEVLSKEGAMNGFEVSIDDKVVSRNFMHSVLTESGGKETRLAYPKSDGRAIYLNGLEPGRHYVEIRSNVDGKESLSSRWVNIIKGATKKEFPF
jgi:hypothetical protein